ncbi:MAG TPA: phenylalanine--tRNA ligase beta subunit-related protein [Chloroflexia bacterium]|nr:phenylalanine--tRNA ligase beta subunit-related protein [Chloroflexia bacterium]
MQLVITPEARALGIDACMAIVSGATISNKSNPLEKLKKEAVQQLQRINLEEDPVLKAYRDLHEKCGLNGVMPPSQHLLSLVQRNGRLPNINTVVDCYNLISAVTRLSIGAHDTAHLRGDLIFKLTDGHEHYIPLGETEPVAVLPGEYACMDAEKIICRMDIKQCAETRITKETREFVIYVQGNEVTVYDYLMSGLRQVCNLLVEICGGQYQIIEAAK